MTTSSKAKKTIDKAYREAGHAVAAWRLGIMLKRVSLKNGKGKNVWNDSLRNVNFEWIQENRSAMVERLATVLVAGVASQTTFADPALGKRSAARLMEAQHLLDSHTANTNGTSIEVLQKDWRDYFADSKVRTALDAIVSHLIEKGSIGGKAATRLLDDHLTES